MQETDNTKCRERCRRITRVVTTIATVLLLVLLICAMIGPPRWLMNWLNCDALKPPSSPRYIVVLGGGSIPSGSSLMRSYCAAQYGRSHTNATFIVALPTAGDPEKSSAARMRDELVLHGIPASSVRMEYHGVDTWQQALGVRRLLGDDALQQPLVIVTSDYHMRRAVLFFHRAGFTNVSAVLAADARSEADAGPWVWFRYTVWNNMIREVYMARELVALLVCKLKGP